MPERTPTQTATAVTDRVASAAAAAPRDTAGGNGVPQNATPAPPSRSRPFDELYSARSTTMAARPSARAAGASHSSRAGSPARPKNGRSALALEATNRPATTPSGRGRTAGVRHATQGAAPIAVPKA